jgi:hypothetical protein
VHSIPTRSFSADAVPKPIKVIKQIAATSDCVNFLIIIIPLWVLLLLKVNDANTEKLYSLPVMPEIQPSWCSQSRVAAV